jgi:hypothetical protein
LPFAFLVSLDISSLANYQNVPAPLGSKSTDFKQTNSSVSCGMLKLIVHFCAGIDAGRLEKFLTKPQFMEGGGLLRI